MNEQQLPLEKRLAHVLALDPDPATMAAVDARVARAINEAATKQQFARPWPARLATRPALAFVLLLVVAGATVAGTGIVGRLGESAPAFRTAWERSTPVGVSQTVNGHTVTVERAYADANQILLGVTVASSSAPPADMQRVRLFVDGSELLAVQLTGIGASNREGTAEILTFATPADAGAQLDLTLTVPTLVRDSTSVPGPWTLRFSLANAGGRRLEPGLRSESGGVTIILEHLTVAPTTVSGRLRLAGGPIESGDGWGPVGSVIHGETNAFTSVRPERDDYGVLTFYAAVRANDELSGSWTLRLDEIVGWDASGEHQVRLAGPWVFDLTVD